MLGRANSLTYVNTASPFNATKRSSSAAYLQILCSSKDYLPMLSAMAENINGIPLPPDSGAHNLKSTRASAAAGHGGSLQNLSTLLHKQTCSTNQEKKMFRSVSLDSICSHCRNRHSISSTSQLSSVVTAGDEEGEEGGSYRTFPKHLMTRQNTYQNINGFEEKFARKMSEKSCDSGVVTTH